jgi:hypothetical protein
VTTHAELVRAEPWRSLVTSGRGAIQASDEQIGRASKLEIGDRVRFSGERQARLKVRAKTRRFVVLTMPAFGSSVYTVIDLEQGVRGADDSYGTGYENDTQILEALSWLESGRAQVSYRNRVTLDIAEVKAG